MSLEYINQYYGLSVFKGQHVIAYGKKGQVMGAHGQYVKIKVEGQKSARPYHPTDGIIYANRNGIFQEQP